MSETSEVIHQCVQAARERKRIRFSKNGLSDIIANAEMHTAFILQLTKLQDEGGVLSLSKHQGLMRAATLCCA